MINAADFKKWLQVFNIPSGGGGGGAVTAFQVQSFAFNTAVATGSDDAFHVALTPPATVLTDGMIVTMNSSTFTNTTTTPTLQVNAIAPKPIVTAWGAPQPNDILEGGNYLFIYDGNENEFFLINPLISGANTFFSQRNFYNSSLDSGVLNAYAAVTTPFNNDFSPAFMLYFQAGTTNTAAATITVNGVTKNIVRSTGDPIVAGDMASGSIYMLVFLVGLDSFVLMNPETPNAAGANSQLQFNNAGKLAGDTGFTTDGAGNVSLNILTINDNQNANSNKIINLLDPTLEQDAATKKYVDDKPASVSWTEVTATTQAMAVNNGYIANNAATVVFTLPSTAAVGTLLKVVGKGAGGWQIDQNAGQNIQIGSVSSTVGTGGNIESINQYDSIQLVCTTANTTWTALATVGNINSN